MAKYIPMDLVKSMSGKICGHSDISFAKRGETLYTMKRCNKRTSEPSQKELVTRSMFAQAREAVKKLTEDQKLTYATAFKKNPGKYATLNGYIFAMEYKKIQNS